MAKLGFGAARSKNHGDMDRILVPFHGDVVAAVLGQIYHFPVFRKDFRNEPANATCFRMLHQLSLHHGAQARALPGRFDHERGFSQIGGRV